MDSDKIRNILQRIDIFIGVFAADQLPRQRITKPSLLVGNTDKSNKPGEHWVAIYIDGNGYGELFDSLANEPLDAHRDFMNRNCTNWIASHVQLQSVVSRFCGHYVIMY